MNQISYTLIGSSNAADTCAAALKKNACQYTWYADTSALAQNIYTVIQQNPKAIFHLQQPLSFPHALQQLNTPVLHCQIGDQPHLNIHQAVHQAIIQQAQKLSINWQLYRQSSLQYQNIKQVHIAIDTSETAGSLLKKCYHGLAITFRLLLHNLDHHLHNTDYSHLTFDNDTPFIHPNGFIKPQQDATTILASIRSLNFRPFNNPVAQAKFWHQKRVYWIKSATLTPNKSHCPFGCIISANKKSVTMATKSVDINLELYQEHTLQPGDHIKALPTSLEEKLTLLLPRVHQHESYWLTQLGKLTPSQSKPKTLVCSNTQHIATTLRQLQVTTSDKVIRYQDISIRSTCRDLEQILAPFCLLDCQQMDSNSSSQHMIFLHRRQTQYTPKKTPFLWDIFARYPMLQREHLDNLSQLTITN